MKKIKNILKKMSTQENDTVNDKNEQKLSEESGEMVNEQDTAADEKDRQITELKAKVDELNDKYLRLYSEFDNFRKRTSKEKVELMQSAGEDVFKGILPVLDDFERAIKSNSGTTDVDAVRDGVQLIFNKLKSSL